MALVPTDKREDRLLERLTLAEERAALATERALGAEAVARAVAAREAEKKPRASRDGALRDAAHALADAQRRLADATAERRRLREEVEDARDAEREWRLKYEGSLSSRTEAERRAATPPTRARPRVWHSSQPTRPRPRRLRSGAARSAGSARRRRSGRP